MSCEEARYTASTRLSHVDLATYVAREACPVRRPVPTPVHPPQRQHSFSARCTCVDLLGCQVHPQVSVRVRLLLRRVRFANEYVCEYTQGRAKAVESIWSKLTGIG